MNRSFNECLAGTKSGTERTLGVPDEQAAPYSHSIVAGGLPEMS